MKNFLKKFKIVNLLFEFYINLIERVTFWISKIFEKTSQIKTIRRIIFNLIPRNKKILIETIYGNFLMNTNDRIITKKSYISKIPYSALSVKKTFDILEKEKIVINKFIDIGANIGTSSISAYHLKENLNFLCIEGNKNNFSLLTKNVKLNDVEDKFKLLNKLVGEKKSTRLFVEFAEEKGCSRVFDNVNELKRYQKTYKNKVINKYEVITEKLEDLISIKPDENPLLWIDVEGLDLEILKSNVFKNRFPVCFEYNPTFYKIKYKNYVNFISEIENYLIDCGYQTAFVESKSYKKQQLDPGFLTDILKHLGENKASTNILLI